VRFPANWHSDVRVNRSFRYVGLSCIAQFFLQGFGVYKTERTYFTSTVLPTLLHRQKLHCATNTAASSPTSLCYQHFCILINCIVLPTLLHPDHLHCDTKLLHPHQLQCATNTAASSSTAVCYQHCCILINCIVIPNCCILINCSVLPTLLHPDQLHCDTKLLHPHQLQCATNTAASSSTAL